MKGCKPSKYQQECEKVSQIQLVPLLPALKDKGQKNDLKMAVSSLELLQMSLRTELTDLDWTYLDHSENWWLSARTLSITKFISNSLQEKSYCLGCCPWF